MIERDGRYYRKERKCQLKGKKVDIIRIQIYIYQKTDIDENKIRKN